MLRDNLEFNKTVKPNSDFLRELKQKLPEFFTTEKYDEDGKLVKESSFDIEKFKVTLQEQNINELSSGYQLDFIGKNYAKKQSGERPTTVIVPDNAHNSKPENVSSKNIFLTGDNLEVLRHLQQNYTNSIDVIYIDPPYNTGNGDFIYPDEFEYSDEALITMFGLNDNELQRLKSIQGKSTHSAWLTFMYSRLYLAKKLLKETGMLFISIDDNEYSNLKAICDEIMGEENFRNNISVRRRVKSLNVQFAEMGLRSYNVGFEYVLVYAKSNETLFNPLERVKDANSEKGRWNVFWSNADRPSMRYDILGFTPKTGQWRWTSDKAKEAVENYEEYLSYHSNMSIEEYSELYPEKRFIRRIEDGVGKNGGVQYFVPPSTTSLRTSNWTDLEVSQIAKEFDLPFDNPKNTKLIKEIISTNTNNNAIVLDFFAGSGTTAHATLQLNAEDGGNRRFIMCTLPEPTFSVNSDGSEQPTKGGKVAYEAGYRSIDEISRERICRAAAKIQAENPLLSDSQDFGFKHYRVVAPTQETMESIEYSNSMQLDLFDDMISKFSSESLGIDGQASGQDTILQTYLVKDGYKFDAKVEWLDIDGVKVPYIEGQRLYIISSSWETQNTRALINAIGTNQIRVQTIVVYGHSIEMARYRELEIALAQLEIRPNLQVRY